MINTFTRDVLRVSRALMYSSEQEVYNTLVAEERSSGDAFLLVKAALIIYNDEHGKDFY